MPIKGYFKGDQMITNTDIGLGQPTYGNALEQLAALNAAEWRAKGQRRPMKPIRQGEGGRASGRQTPGISSQEQHERAKSELDWMMERKRKAGQAAYEGALQAADIRGPRTELIPTGYGWMPVEDVGSLPWSMRPKTTQMIQGGTTPEERMREELGGLRGRTEAEMDLMRETERMRRSGQRPLDRAAIAMMRLGAGRR